MGGGRCLTVRCLFSDFLVCACAVLSPVSFLAWAILLHIEHKANVLQAIFTREPVLSPD